MWPELDRYLRWLAGWQAPNSVTQRRSQLTRFARAHPDPWAVTLDDVDAWIAAEHAPDSKRSMLSALRGFYGWSVRRRAAPLHDPDWLDPTADAARVRVPGPGVLPCPQEVFWAAESNADDDGELMLLLGAHCGLRCAEIAAVHARDVAGDMLRVTGKGGKVRLVPLPHQIAGLIGRRSGWAFPARNGVGHLRAGTVSKKLARLLPGGWTGHTLRHAYATHAYQETKDIVAVQQLLGHASPATTRRYIAALGDSVHAAAAGAASRMPSRRRLRALP